MRTPCGRCAAPLGTGQRYCLACGARRADGMAPDALDILRAGPRTRPAPARAGAPAVPVRAALALFAAALTFGVAVGALGGPRAEPTLARQPAPRYVVASAPEPEPEPVARTPAEPARPEQQAEPARASAPETEAARPSAPAVTTPGDDEAPAARPERPPDATPEPTVPKLEHVWVVSLADQDFDAIFGPGARSPYLARELVTQGRLLSGWRAVARGNVANGVALLSGQRANPATEGNCATVTDVSPGTIGAYDQVEGEGCLYPAALVTLPDQLTIQGGAWRAYVGGLQAPPCAPAIHVPFTWFHSIVDLRDCGERVTPLDRLDEDVADARRTPALSWIVPGPCAEGIAAPCDDAFLRGVVPKVLASEAWAKAGLVVVLADQPPPGAPADEPVGALLLSPFVDAGTKDAARYDHLTLTRLLADVFGLTPPGLAAADDVRALPRATWSRLDRG